MKFIFLDFDGVLNSRKFLRSQFFQDSIAGLTDAELYLTKYEYMLDPEAIKLLNSLVERTSALVVASTSHRNRYTLDELNTMLKGRGATFLITGKTPKVFPKKFSQSVDRGDEIQAFLNTFPDPPESFVILDDHNNMVHLTKHLVLTSDLTGLRMNHIEDAIKILNGDVK